MRPTIITVMAGLAAAQAAAGQDSFETEPAADAPAHVDERVSLDLSLAYTSDYYFRGIVQRSDSFNLQPAATVGYTLVDDEAYTLTLLGGVWANFSDDTAPGASGSFGEHFYEVDFFAGASLEVDRLTLTGLYTWYESPSSDFVAVEDITLTASYDDSGWWGDDGSFALKPWASIAFETRNAASGPDSGVWLGLGIAPSFDLGETALGPATLSLPVTVGLSVDDYYQRGDGSSETYGFTEAGVRVSFDLAERYGAGAPSLSLGVSYLDLGGALQDLNGGDGSEVILSAALNWSF